MEAEEERLWKELRDAAYKEADEARHAARQKFEVSIMLCNGPLVQVWKLHLL